MEMTRWELSNDFGHGGKEFKGEGVRSVAALHGCYYFLCG